MEEKGTMKVEDALILIAQNLENIRMPDGITAGQAKAIILPITQAVENLRMCSDALRNAAAAKRAEKAEVLENDEADAE